MFIHKTEQCTIYFGDASQSITIDEIQQKKITQNLASIADQMGVQQMVFLHQTHGVQGAVIKKNDNKSQFFQYDGDYLVTNKKGCGIGVVTADCLPIVVYDPIHHATAIIHAGWKGSAADIFTVALNNMVEEFETSISELQLYFGPAARTCCYEVSADFIDNFKQYANCDDAFVKKNSKIYFDSTVFTAIIARNLGIKDKNIYTTYNVCTICDTSFCSFRREKEKSSRQVTLISLH